MTGAAIPRESDRPDDAEWQALLAIRGGGPAGTASQLSESMLHSLYGPLCVARRKGPFAVAHLAQSLDGRIATTNGMSQWMSGAEDLLHMHRMRALSDAVIVGVNTVLIDNPQLTVRQCEGTNPVRVIIDPERRLDGSQRVFHDPAAATLVLAAADRVAATETLGHAEVIPVARGERGLDPHEIRRVLANRGLTCLFIEGGGVTVSRFLAAGALDRLQITLAPLILGSGRPGIGLEELGDLSNSLRPRTRRFILGDDIMVECDFSG